MPKVLIADKLSPQAIDVFRQNKVDADVKVGLSEAELLGIIGEYDGIAVRSATKVTAKVLEAGKKAGPELARLIERVIARLATSF